MRRLRVLHVIVQPVLVWDDGEELEPGPPLEPSMLRLSQASEWFEALPAAVAGLIPPDEPHTT